MNSISSYLSRFYVTKNPIYIVKAGLLLIKQKRIFEVIYSFYCYVFYSPSEILLDEKNKKIMNKYHSWVVSRKFYTMDDIVEVFGDKYCVHHLPSDFSGTRAESIVYEPDGILIIGEYGFYKKRIFCITFDSYSVCDFYIEDKNIIHIHAIYKSRLSKEILVTTGDTDKVLDSWMLENNKIIFKSRIKKYLAGYTAITMVKGVYYFGTDFSNRPNYIERIDGKKYFFPKKSYKMYVMAFYKYNDRYIISVNKELVVFGGRYTASIFDTRNEKFIFCDFIDHEDDYDLFPKNGLFHRLD